MKDFELIPLQFTRMLSGAVFEDHREERVPGVALGAIHHHQRKLSAQNELITHRHPYRLIGREERRRGRRTQLIHALRQRECPSCIELLSRVEEM